MEQEHKSFKYWLAQDVEKIFGIKRTRTSAVLDAWLSADTSISKSSKEAAEVVRARLELNVDNWNEAALKFFHIGPLVSLVEFNQEDYNGFLEQSLFISTPEISARGNIDFMVATGRQKAEAPYYLLHEYKPELNTITDAKGQLLIAMIAARQENEAINLTQPIYGTYVLGRFWFFVVLNGNEYTISKAYDATQVDDHTVVFRALHTVKQYIQQLFAEMQG